MFVAVGFHRVKTVGERATRQRAPVLAVAPHSSFYDGLAAVIAGGPTVVAKEENSSIPVVGSEETRARVFRTRFFARVQTGRRDRDAVFAMFRAAGQFHTSNAPVPVGSAQLNLFCDSKPVLCRLE